MKGQDLYRQKNGKKTKIRLHIMVLLILCNVSGICLASPLGNSSPAADQRAITEKSTVQPSRAIAFEEQKMERQKERAARIMRARQGEKDKEEITLNLEQRKKLALLLLVAGGKARNIHFL